MHLKQKSGASGSVSTSAASIQRASEQPIRALVLLALAAVLALTGVPMLSGSAQAVPTGTDMTDAVATELSYQALAEDGTWVESDPGQVQASIEDGTALMRAVLTWTLEDETHVISNGDYFSFDMGQIHGGGSSTRL
ncbi:hypothetical protein [Raoultibacter phocaeensis]|uniref:hypothetical protein n=1 Tax=Raoultibacter phocaeensis TaxID=2479841 RepID=UPI001119171F|nr:hypothetical protein [Raoultibacter phocaeensis]